MIFLQVCVSINHLPISLNINGLIAMTVGDIRSIPFCWLYSCYQPLIDTINAYPENVHLVQANGTTMSTSRIRQFQLNVIGTHNRLEV